MIKENDRSCPCYNEGKGCDKRQVTSTYNCHSDCHDYAVYKQDRMERSTVIYKKRADEAMITDTRIKSVYRTTGKKRGQSAWKGG